jgi:ATP-dependent helicase/DNAse subunit B
VVSSSQGYGIDVVSYLDTLNLENEYLFILGMNEGEFPLSIKMNPYLAESVFNPWFMNVHLFERWLRRDTGRLFMTAPLKDLDGNSLQISTFCQYLAKAEYPDNPPYSSAERLSALAGNLITDPRSDYQRRHNYLLRRSNDHEWSGKLKASSEKSIYEISASAMDDLLKCPQKYWYGRILELKTLETDISRRDETWVGNLVHEVLEHFGRSGGFELAAKDLASAYKEYELAAKSILAKHEDMIGRGLLNKKWMALYFSNYMDSDKNLIAAMLKLESQYLNEYDEKYFEKSFGYKDEESWPEVVIDNENIKLHIKGKIDRVFIKKDQIWATDYKTGNIDLSETRDFWTSQMLYYFLAIKMRYQNAEVMLTYQQLKSFKSKYYGFKGFIGDTAGDYAVLAGATKRNTIQIADESDWSVERIKNETLKYAQYLVRNSYPLTEREEEIACKYCDFERVCRRHSMPR